VILGIFLVTHPMMSMLAYVPTLGCILIPGTLVLDIIRAHRKLLQKAVAECDKLGERGAAHAAQLRFEQQFCEGDLPKGMDEAAARALVKERLASLGIADVKRIAEELLKG
jgi:hypothetical protein